MSLQRFINSIPLCISTQSSIRLFYCQPDKARLREISFAFHSLTLIAIYFNNHNTYLVRGRENDVNEREKTPYTNIREKTITLIIIQYLSRL